jgi:hypothetical protein
MTLAPTVALMDGIWKYDDGVVQLRTQVKEDFRNLPGSGWGEMVSALPEQVQHKT